MSDAILVAIIAALPATLAVIIGLRNARAVKQSQAEIVATKKGVFEVGRRIDGRLTELLAETARSARAEGRSEGVASEQARTRGPE